MQKIKEQIKDYQEPNHTIQDLKNLETQNLLKNGLLMEVSNMLDVLIVDNDYRTDVFKGLKIQIDSLVQSSSDLADINTTISLVSDVVKQVCKE